jgi:sugar lactone lactonase YvrE
VCVLCGLLGVACAARGTVSSPPAATPSATAASVGQLGANYPIGHADAVIASATDIWLLDSSEQGLLYRFQPAAQAVVASIPVGLAAGSRRQNLAVTDTALWLAYPAEGTLRRIDPQTNQVVATFHVASGQLGPITASPTAVWTADPDAPRVLRLDPTTGAVAASIPLAITPTSLAFGAGALWVCGAQGGAAGLARIDPQSNQVVAQIDLGAPQGARCSWVQVLGGALWVVALDPQTQRNDLLEHLDPATNRVLATIPLPGDLQPPLALAGPDVWAGATMGLGSACDLVRVAAQATRLIGTMPASGCDGMLESAGSLWLLHGPPGSLRLVTPTP